MEDGEIAAYVAQVNHLIRLALMGSREALQLISGDPWRLYQCSGASLRAAVP